MKVGDNDLKVGRDDRRGALGFTGLNIPANSIINSAIMYWDNGEGGGKTTSLDIFAHDVASPGTFTTTTSDITNRPRTSNFAKFDIDWSGDEMEYQHQN